MTAAGARGIPQIVSIGCYDLVDLVGWHPVPSHLADLPGHAHNRLLSSVVLDAEARRKVARAIMGKLSAAKGEVVFLLPTRGGNEWDREGGPLCDTEGLAAFCDEMRKTCPENVRLVELDAHINDPAFSDAALGIVDSWIAAGLIR
jgi:uncharacterized protein (UPF0261 family)